MVERAEVFLEDCPASPIGHILALKSYLEGSGESLPIIDMSSLNDVTVYLTHACNLRCSHCYLSAGEPLSNELGVDGWLTVIDRLKELGVRFIYLLGGEPTLLIRRGLPEIIRYATDLGFYVSLSTNGTLINRDTATALSKAGLAQVQVSIDGPNPAINDAIRGVGTFDAAVKAVKVFKELNIGVSLSYTVTSSNAYYVRDMVKLAEELGVPVLTFIRVQEFGRALSNGITISDEEARMVIRELMGVKTTVKLVLNGFRFHLDDLHLAYEEARKRLAELGIRNYSTCPAGRSRFVIDSNGDVYGCELLMIKELREGNALKDDLRRVWRDGFKAFRNRGYGKIAPCNACPLADLCNAGCPARAYRVYGRVDSPDPQCPLVKQITKVRIN